MMRSRYLLAMLLLCLPLSGQGAGVGAGQEAPAFELPRLAGEEGALALTDLRGKVVEEIPVTYPVVRDASGATPAAYGVLGMPTGYLIDRQGVVRKVHQGFRKSDGEKLRQEIIELLAVAP